ncbi:MAG: hypothetical protein OEV28_01660 [Nitrospirota bacterium]|nr:hypothetical protein [Nitrospirota bacterium]
MPVIIGLFLFSLLFTPSYGQDPPAKAGETGATEQQDRSPLAESLARKEAELKKREEALKVEEERIAQVKKGIADELAKLDAARKDIEKLLEDNRALLGIADDVREKNLKRLAKIFDSMPAEQLAPVVEKLDINLLLQVVSRMKPKQAAKVMAVLSPELSARISGKMGKAEPLKEQ